MNVAEFTYLISKPEKVTKENIDSIETIIKEFPFFQPAKAVYLKALKNQDSFRYNAALKHTAAYTTDRSILFDLITSKSFIQNKIAENITKQISEIYDIEVVVEEIIPEISTETKKSIIKNIVDEKSTKKEIVKKKELPKTSFDFDNVNSEAVMDPDLFLTKPTIKNYSILSIKTSKKIAAPIKTEKVIIEKVTIKKTPEVKKIKKATPEKVTIKKTVEEKKLKIGKPLAFDKAEEHSFSEWLRLSKIKPIKRNEEDNVKNKKKTLQKKTTTSAKFKLIDKFIENRPKITPSEEKTPKNNLAKEREVPKSELMTETLARVYLEQKKYKKAIQAYKILSLKYPEKSSFFADQINAVEKLQQNN